MFQVGDGLAGTQGRLYSNVVQRRIAMRQSPRELIDGTAADANRMDIDGCQTGIKSGQESAFMIARHNAQIAAHL
jgi:hypothetical protein